MAKVTTKTANKSLNVLTPKDRQAAQQVYEQAPWYDAKSPVKFNDKALFCENVSDGRLLTKADVDYIEKIIDSVYKRSNYTPTQLQETDDDLIGLGTIVKYLPRDMKKFKELHTMACVIREWRNTYKIFINELVEDEAYDSADLHEKGHIIFNHTQGYKIYIDQFKKLLDPIWDTKLAKYFDATTMKNSKDKIVKMLFHEFSNIAQDMEINSKLFDNGEWFKAKKTLSRSAILISFIDLQNQFDDLSGLIKNVKARKTESKEYMTLVGKFHFILKSLIDRINGEEGDFQFCYPANRGWPEKLDWMTYMVLLVKDIDETMEQVMKQIAAACGQNGSPCDSGQGKTVSQDVLDKYADQMESQEKAEESESEELDDSGDEEDGPSFGRSAGSDGRSRTGHSDVQLEFETCETFDNFTKFLRKNCLGKKNRKLNSDVLYNSNRGKFASRVVVPRRHFIEKWMPTECHIIVDVSGSVPTNYVERVINSIVDTNSGIDLKNSHIIFCDTRVVSDEIMSARTKSVYAGGGTEIAEGIKYVKEKGYLRKATDKLFIISDFEDDLQHWIRAAEGMPGIKYAIGYNVHSKEDCERTMSRGSRRDDNEFNVKWNNTFKTVFITERIRD